MCVRWSQNDSRIHPEEGTMAFKVFEKGSAPAPSLPAVTIQKRGLFLSLIHI